LKQSREDAFDTKELPLSCRIFGLSGRKRYSCERIEGTADFFEKKKGGLYEPIGAELASAWLFSKEARRLD